jgi:hypothetical protein
LHSFCKLVTKVLTVRVSPFMHQLVQPDQYAFIKGRVIHDSFKSVQSSAKLLDTRKCSCVFLKIDKAKAFDTVSWSFLLELLAFKGFSRRWTNWLSALLSSGSSRILLNGNQGQRIFHAWGLRQGDPLSPFLLVLAMEALNALFWPAGSWGVLTSLRALAIRYHLSLCTDDLVIFIMPSDRNLCYVWVVLQTFVEASGLCSNISKSMFTPI